MNCRRQICILQVGVKMIKKLKIRFVAVIMAIVTVLFAVGICCITVLTMQGIERDSIRMMSSFASKRLMFQEDLQGFPEAGAELSGDFDENFPENGLPENGLPEDGLPENPEEKNGAAFGGHLHEPVGDSREDRRERMPYMLVSRAEGELKVRGSLYPDMSEEELLEIYEEALSSNAPTGIISRYHLRYCKAEPPASGAVVFGDISGERAMGYSLIKSCLLIGGVGWGAVFIIAVILAGRAVKPVERAFEEQKQFVADASHELKTPLTVIMTNCEMLLGNTGNAGGGGSASSANRQYGENILEMSRRMRGLTESLLELARMDNGSVISGDEVDMGRLVLGEVMPFEPLFYEDGKGLTWEIEENIKVKGDGEKLRQVAGILLDNALKYSKPSSTVTVELCRRGNHCVLSVKSEGEEISKADCVNIFKRFYRIDKARSGGSYGLGLSIAKSIVEAHGGRIKAESSNGVNCFSVQLDMEKASTGKAQ